MKNKMCWGLCGGRQYLEIEIYKKISLWNGARILKVIGEFRQDI
jgi:hypothetical protein